MTAANMKWLSNLSKIAFDDEELIQIENDMTSIMILMDSLRDVELPSESSFLEYATINTLREDTVCKSLDTSLLTSGQKENTGCFSIPKIIE